LALLHLDSCQVFEEYKPLKTYPTIVLIPFSGAIAFFSMGGIPVISTAPPSQRAKQWELMYQIGAARAPYIAVFAAGAWGLLARNGKISPVV
jgi:hypothetical protein